MGCLPMTPGRRPAQQLAIAIGHAQVAGHQLKGAASTVLDLDMEGREEAVVGWRNRSSMKTGRTRMQMPSRSLRGRRWSLRRRLPDLIIPET